MIQNIRRLLIFLFFISSPLWISWIIWILSPTLPLKVRLVDYTVPYDRFEEHSASFWTFNHIKLQAPNIKNYWDPAEDYIGPPPFEPYLKRRLSNNTIDRNVDMIYVADTYGVYREDFRKELIEDGKVIQVTGHSDPKLLKKLYERKEIGVHMDFSKLIFGGLSDKDLDVLEQHTQNNKDLFLEFNALCDPTKTAERLRAEALVGIRWTGWSGRFLLNPHDLDDAPHWLARMFKKQYPNRKLPTDPSLLLVHRDGRIFIISDPNSKKVVPYLQVKIKYQNRFNTYGRPPYFFWFAVMEPIPPESVKNSEQMVNLLQSPSTQDLKKNSKALLNHSHAQVLAELELPLVNQSDAIYKMLGFNRKLPLLTEYIVGSSHRYHLSIDGSDIRDQLGNYRFAGLQTLNSLSPKNRGISMSQRPTFWQFYLPVLYHLLWERSQARYQDFPRPLWQRTYRLLQGKISQTWSSY
jgi:hypothetical protein